MNSELDKTLSGMIFSASGWRGIFAKDGGGESSCREISAESAIIAATAAKVFSDYLTGAKSAVIVGRDTRPTGEAIADAVIRSLLASGRKVLYTGITAAPEIMAYSRNRETAGSAAGFIYISASHNPIGHNGIKFGLNDGGVLQAGEAAKLVTAFKSLIIEKKEIERLRSVLANSADKNLAEVYSASGNCKKAALTSYMDFTAEVISGYKDKTKSDDFFASLREGVKKKSLSIAVDFNGSARTVSIDRDFFGSLGVGFYSLNDVPGQIVHRIIPEGESLTPCRAFLEEIRRKDPSCILGYMPDCDGDRGNLVFFDEKEQCARILEAQEVFALACVAELSSLVFTGELKYDEKGKALTGTAIAVNDPTSFRIERIAAAFGADVFRAEVGEANVVGLAKKLREEGYLVRILGEGSSGGTITHPSAVRDPIDTLGAILKLLSLRRDGANLFKIWCGRSGQAEKYNDDFTLSGIIATLPAFVTTGSTSEDALLSVKTLDHGLLKDRYQKIFLREWEEKKEILQKDYGISGWEAVAYNGIKESRGIERFGEAGHGGLKIEFQGSGGEKKIASIWMRGSGTEPVFRIMADAKDGNLEQILIGWQRRMVQEADALNNVRQ